MVALTLDLKCFFDTGTENYPFPRIVFFFIAIHIDQVEICFWWFLFSKKLVTNFKIYKCYLMKQEDIRLQHERMHIIHSSARVGTNLRRQNLKSADVKSSRL